MPRRKNPDSDFFLIAAAVAGVGWYFWNQSQTASAAPAAAAPLTAPAAATIVASAVTAAAAPPPVATSPSIGVPFAPSVANGNILVTGFDAQGNPTQQWTGPGTANPQAGEISGANPGLAQLATQMGMSTAATQAWLTANTVNS